MSDDNNRERFVIMLGVRWFGALVFLAALTGHINCGGCGFERDYVGDLIDAR